jgi:histidinol-phosphate aminotransferase
LIFNALDEVGQVNQMIIDIVNERKSLQKELTKLSVVETVYPSDANFLLVKVVAAKEIYQFLVERGIVVRDRSQVELCEGCLRITVGTPQENKLLLKAMAEFDSV